LFSFVLQLEELSLGGNCFAGGLTRAIGRLKRLKKLDLDHCELNKIPGSIRHLEQVSCIVKAPVAIARLFVAAILIKQ